MAAGWDVVVVGAGPGGSSCAYFLAQHGLRVLLVDKNDFPRDKTCGDGLTPRALEVCERMGIGPELARSGLQIEGIDVIAPNGVQTRVDMPRVDGRDTQGMVIRRFVLDQILWRRALDAGADVRTNVRIKAIQTNGGGAGLVGECKGKQVQYAGRLVVIATGAQMRLLRTVGLLKHNPEVILAVRGYLSGLRELAPRMVFRFDHVPLPGYGWLFPIAEDAANVGLGYFPKRSGKYGSDASTRSALKSMLRQTGLASAAEVEASLQQVKGYPIRTDFLRAQTFAEGILVVGEAAGLVNPLTGEGIDYALESGQIAAGFIHSAFAAGEFSSDVLSEYDRLLRGRFQRLFEFSERVRLLTMNRPLMNFLVSMANSRSDLRRLLTRILTGYQAIPDRLTPAMVWRLLQG